MKVVTCYKASKIAGVSKQAIHSLKNANALQKGKYPFFCYDPIKGNFGVDVENREWKNYLDRNKHHPARKNKQDKQTNGQLNCANSPNTVDKEALIDAVVKSINKVFKPPVSKLRELLKMIEDIYEGRS